MGDNIEFWNDATHNNTWSYTVTFGNFIKDSMKDYTSATWDTNNLTLPLTVLDYVIYSTYVVAKNEFGNGNKSNLICYIPPISKGQCL